jgi:hypothetical protein
LVEGSTVGPAIVLPEVVPVAFHFTPPDGTVVTSARLDNAEKGWGFLATRPQSIVGADPYRTFFAPGLSHLLVSFTLNDPAPFQRTVTYQTNVTIPAAGGEQSIHVPAVPATVTFSGRVTVPEGLPAAGVVISISPFPPPDAELQPYTMSARVTADADGRFSVPLLPGRYAIDYPAPLF